MAYLRLKKFDHSDPIAICKLIFTPDKRSFQAGDILQGFLIVSLTAKRELSFHGFKVAMVGTSLTKYNDRRDSMESRTEIFLDVHKYVYGKEPPLPNSNQIGMSPGVHKFPFSFRIPSGYPGSLNVPFGTITYQIIAYIHMAWNRILQKAEKPFELKSRLTIDPFLLSPYEFQEVLLGENTSSPSQIKLILRLTQRGFLVGDEIPFGLELQCSEEFSIASISMALLQKSLYHPGNQKMATKTFIALSTLETKEGTVWVDSLQIPPGTRSTYEKGIIQTHYCLKIEVNFTTAAASLSQAAKTLSAEAPIVIGTSIEGHTGESAAASCVSSPTLASAAPPSTSPKPSTSKYFHQESPSDIDVADGFDTLAISGLSPSSSAYEDLDE